MTSSKIPTSVVVGAAAVGVGVVVGAGLAYLSTRVMYSTRVAQQISLLHDNIVEMKQNLALIEHELGRLHTTAPESSTEPSVRNNSSLLQHRPLGTHSSGNLSTTSSRRSTKSRKNVSFSSAVSHSSYTTCRSPVPNSNSSSADSFVTAAEDTLSAVGAPSDAGSAYDTDYFSPDEGDEEDDHFFDMMPSDAEDTDTSRNDTAHSWSIEEVPASALSELLRRVDAQFNSGSEEDIEAAHNTLLEAETTYHDNAEVLWRLAKSCRNMATMEEKRGDTMNKRTFIFQAYVYAERSLAINSGSPDTHKWFAITAGARGEFLGTKERIASGRVFKKHIDAALSYSPNDATLHHLLGRFCYEISGLTWLERKAAAALFGAVPESSYTEALHHFQAAESLHDRGWKENRLFIAKCLIKLGETNDVSDWLHKGLDLPTATADDMLVDKELQQLVQKYSAP